MSAAVIILAAFGLVFWVAVAWWMIATQPPDAFGWQDQLMFAFWPVAVPLVFLHDLLRWLLARWRAR